MEPAGGPPSAENPAVWQMPQRQIGQCLKLPWPKSVLPVSGAEAKLLGDGEEGPVDAAIIREADN
jgi:hypothetical protein